MSGAWAVCKREVKAYFTTPVGYIVLGTYALISGLGFTASFLRYALMTESPSTFGLSAALDFEESFLSPFMVYCGTIMMFIGPLITMVAMICSRVIILNQGRIVAEEEMDRLKREVTRLRGVVGETGLPEPSRTGDD